MDFVENKNSCGKRHPWEVAKGFVAHYLLKKHLKQGDGKRIIDVGCGDCYFLGYLKDRYGERLEYFGVDDGAPEGFENAGVAEGIEFSRSLDNLGDKKFDIILMMDVIEHVDDDAGFIKEVAEKCAVNDGVFLITAPAFQALFGAHDRALRHKRRYGEKDLVRIISESGVKRIESGYYFFSLLAVRALSVLIEKIFGRKEKEGFHGIGGWTGGALVTRVVSFALKADFMISRLLKRVFVNIPGLSVYILCKKQV